MRGKSKLTGQALADEYARRHPLSERNPGKVYAVYMGGGWIRLSGHGLAPHPDLSATYPNGWDMGSNVRSGEARAELADDFAAIRKSYADVP